MVWCIDDSAYLRHRTGIPPHYASGIPTENAFNLFYELAGLGCSVGVGSVLWSVEHEKFEVRHSGWWSSATTLTSCAGFGGGLEGVGRILKTVCNVM